MTEVTKPKKYLLIFLCLCFGVCWGICLLYALISDTMTKNFGELTLTNPLVHIILNIPGVAAFIIYYLYGGKKAVLDFLKTLVPRKKDLKWIPIVLIGMVVYLTCVRLVCIAIGIAVPDMEYSLPKMLKIFLRNFIGETGMIGQIIGWFGFLLPYLHSKTKNGIVSGIWTGFIFSMFLMPGYVFSSFEAATSFPFYMAQNIMFSVCATFILNEVKGNLLFMLLAFWIAATGSKVKLYDFIPSVQIVQISLFVVLFVILYFVFRKRNIGKTSEEVLPMFPNFLYQKS